MARDIVRLAGMNTNNGVVDSFAKRLSSHWVEYLLEAWALGTFMVSASLATIVLEYPGSVLNHVIANADVRRALIGTAMGLTAVLLINSPWGQRSGAHMNPAVTLVFLRLGKVTGMDAVSYIVAQCIGGTLGIELVYAFLPHEMTAPQVNFIVTVPGASGTAVAFFAEAAISGFLMFVILTVSNSEKYARYTGYCAGILVALYISVEAPLSGMSINPARTFASALPSGIWTAFWIYVLAPVGSMQVGALLFLWPKRHSVRCGKLLHADNQRCIHCGYTPQALVEKTQSAIT